jgi:DNA-directed RNA polymerase subunit RPC12/RpoP
MGAINLEDVIISYEGQNLPVTTLISKLQTQLQEATCRIAAIAATLGDMQATLLNSNTLEVKLTLSREDLGRLRSLEGTDDSERIRKVVMTVIHAGKAEFPSNPVGSRPLATPDGIRSAAPPVEFRPEVIKAADPVRPHEPGPRFSEQIVQERQPTEAEIVTKNRPTTKCPRCQSLIDLPETSNDQWSVEIKCGNCGTKYLVKSKTDAFVRSQS